jgi:hypothetical protein
MTFTRARIWHHSTMRRFAMLAFASASAFMALAACVGDDPNPVGTIVIYADAQADGAADDSGAETSSSSSSSGDGGVLLPSFKLVWVSHGTQSNSELKDGDGFCTRELKTFAAGRGGNAIAWAQGPDGTSPKGRIDGLAYAGPWVLPSGRHVFETKADITGGAGAANGIVETLDGQTMHGRAWTGLTAAGDPDGAGNCQGWDKPSGAAAGAALGQTGTQWANDGQTVQCQTKNSILCLEQ